MLYTLPIKLWAMDSVIKVTISDYDTESLNINITKSDDIQKEEKFIYPYKIFDQKRDAQGDRLSAKRDYWKKQINDEDIISIYDRQCQETFPTIRSKNHYSIRLNLFSNTRFSQIHLLSCLFSNWKVKYQTLMVLNQFFEEEQIRPNFREQATYYQRLFLNNLSNSNAYAYGQVSNLLDKLSASPKTIYSSKNFNIAENLNHQKINKSIYTDKIYQKGLIVTHATTAYDLNANTKKKIDHLISSYKDQDIPVHFLMDDDLDQNWFTKDRNPDDAFLSRWGEHNLTYEDEVTIIGGQWNNCLRVSIVDAVTRHFANFPNKDFIIHLPLKAIYTENNEILFDRWKKEQLSLKIKELIPFVERASIFGGYEIIFDDPHDGPITITNDMNKYTGVANLAEYTYQISIDSKHLYKDTKNPGAQRLVIFNFIQD